MDIGWIYLIIGVVLGFIAATIMARSLYQDSYLDDIEIVLCTGGVFLGTLTAWPAMVIFTLLGCFFWVFYQIVTPGKFEFPEFITNRKKKRRELR